VPRNPCDCRCHGTGLRERVTRCGFLAQLMVRPLVAEAAVLALAGAVAEGLGELDVFHRVAEGAAAYINTSADVSVTRHGNLSGRAPGGRGRGREPPSQTAIGASTKITSA
jgi:hypothetical protein